jgi:hypothetical protein
MHLFFLDESGTPPSPTKQIDRYFVVGGLAIPDGVWHKVRDSFHGMKVRRKLNGVIKWRYFTAQNKGIIYLTPLVLGLPRDGELCNDRY